METQEKKPVIGMAASAKLLGLKWYYGMVYSYGRAKNLTVKDSSDSILVLGQRYPKRTKVLLKQGSHEAFTPGGTRVKKQKEQPSEEKETIEEKCMEEKPVFFSGEECKIEENGNGEPTESPSLKKNLSESPLTTDDHLKTANDALQEAISMLACFTYRSHWDKPIKGTHLFSDAGWGCMIRAGQMCFFNCLIRDQMSKQEGFLEDRLKCLLIQFNDNLTEEVAPFSIQNIVPLAYEKFSIPMGNWFRSTSIMMALDQLNCHYQPSQSKHIRMVTMLDATFTLSKAYEALFDQSSVTLAEDQIRDAMSQPWGDKKLILSLSAMLGSGKPQEEFETCLNYLLSLPWSMGALGGRDNRAYYIFGLNEKMRSYYYLDPHTVQVVSSVTSSRP